MAVHDLSTVNICDLIVSAHFIVCVFDSCSFLSSTKTLFSFLFSLFKCVYLHAHTQVYAYMQSQIKSSSKSDSTKREQKSAQVQEQQQSQVGRERGATICMIYTNTTNDKTTEEHEHVQEQEQKQQQKRETTKGVCIIYDDLMEINIYTSITNDYLWFFFSSFYIKCSSGFEV